MPQLRTWDEYIDQAYLVLTRIQCVNSLKILSLKSEIGSKVFSSFQSAIILSALQWSHLTQISLSGTWCVFFRTFFFDAVSNWRQNVWWQYCGLEDIWRMWSPTCDILQVPAPTVQFWWRGNSAAAVILYPARSLTTKYCLVWWTSWWQVEHAARIFSFSGEKTL